VTVQPLPPKGHEAASKLPEASSPSRPEARSLVTPVAIAELSNLEIPPTTALRAGCECSKGSEKLALTARRVNTVFSQRRGANKRQRTMEK
jgi:hypothetical protein